MDKSKYAPKDPEVEQMLRDLGLDRRDGIARATEERGTSQRELERRERAQAREALEAGRVRRERYEQAVAAGNQNAINLAGWNNLNLDPDPQAAQSSDIGGGQLHRAPLAAAVAAGHIREQDEPRGSRNRNNNNNREGANFPSRNSSGGNGNYAVVPGPQPGSSGGRSTIPRTRPGMQIRPLPNSRVAGPARPDGHARVPSPRSFGTRRFVGGHQVERRTGSGGDNNQSAAAPGSRLTPSHVAGGNNTHPPPALRSSLAPSDVAVTAPPLTSTSAATANTTSTQSAAAASATSTVEAASSSSQAATAGWASRPVHTTNFTLYRGDDYVQRIQLQYRALFAAATGGATRDQFLLSHLEAASYLRSARHQLITEVTNLVKEGDNRETTNYNSTHPERQWMVRAAVWARDMATIGMPGEVRGHYEAYPEERDFYEAALDVYGDGDRRERADSSSTTDAAATSSALESHVLSGVDTQTPTNGAGAASTKRKASGTPNTSSSPTTTTPSRTVSPHLRARVATAGSSGAGATSTTTSQSTGTHGHPQTGNNTYVPNWMQGTNFLSQPSSSTDRPNINRDGPANIDTNNTPAVDSAVASPTDKVKQGTLTVVTNDNGQQIKVEHFDLDTPCDFTLTINPTGHPYEIDPILQPIELCARSHAKSIKQQEEAARVARVEEERLARAEQERAHRELQDRLRIEREQRVERARAEFEQRERQLEEEQQRARQQRQREYEQSVAAQLAADGIQDDDEEL